MQSSGTRYNADNMNRHMLPAGTNPQELPDSLVTFRTAADFFKIRKTGSLFCPDQMDSINLAKPVRHFELIEGGFSKMQFVLDEMRKRYLETGIQQGIQQGEKQGMKKADDEKAVTSNWTPNSKTEKGLHSSMESSRFCPPS